MGLGLGILGATAGAGKTLEDLIAQRRADQLMQQSGLQHLMQIESLMQNRAALQQDREEKIAAAKEKATSDAQAKADTLKQRGAENVDKIVNTFSPGQLIPMERYQQLAQQGGEAFPKDLFSEQQGIGAPNLQALGAGAEGPTQPPGMKFGGTFSQLQKIKEDETNADFKRAQLKQSGDIADWKASIAQQLADMKAGGATPDQNKLEQQYRTILTRPLSSRSGGLGLEDQKVNQANHLLALLDQYEGKPMPAQIQAELALGLARLTSPSGQVGVQLEQEFNQKTAQGQLSKAMAYLLGDPTLVNATPEKLREMFSDSIRRQGEVAAQQREQYMNYLRSLAPTDLEEPRRLKLEGGLLNQLSPRKALPVKKQIRYDMNGNPIS